MKTASLLLAFSFSAICAGNFARAQGAGNIHQYQVTVTATVSFKSGSFWDSSVRIGTPMTATFLFDASSAPASASATNTNYQFDLPSSLSVGNYSLTAAYTGLQIWDNNSSFGDGYLWGTGLAQESYAGHFFGFGAQLTNNVNFSVLTGMSQPIEVLDLSKIDFPTLYLKTLSDFDGVLDGTITSYTVTPVSAVPEPAEYAAIAGLCGALAVIVRRRSRCVAGQAQC